MEQANAAEIDCEICNQCNGEMQLAVKSKSCLPSGTFPLQYTFLTFIETKLDENL
jgi:hypothetical protein